MFSSAHWHINTLKINILLFCISLFSKTSIGQISPRINPYQLSWQIDGSLGLAGIGTYAASTYFLFGAHKVKPLTPASIMLLDRNDIPKIDRSATYNWSPTVSHISDGISTFSLVTPALLMFDKKIRPDWYKVGIMSAEVFLLNSGVTNSTKLWRKRTRPYAYNPDVPMSEKEKLKTRLSFFSGHTSMSSSMCFYTAMVYHDYNKGHVSVPFVWAGAAIVPAVTGFLRWKAGKHYFTDILTGYLVGAAIGILVPQLHKIKIH